MTKTTSRDWKAILAHAAAIIATYESPLTLRQLYYRLVADGTLENSHAEYKAIGRHTSNARRAGTFPQFVDRSRSIGRATSFRSADDAKAWLGLIYRRNRTEGQASNVYLGIEKDSLAGLLWDWFGHLGVGIISLHGYESQTLDREIAEEIEADGRPAIMLYAGDYDPSGQDIARNLGRHVPGLKVRQIALTAEQVSEYDLPVNPGKNNDPRQVEFMARNGELVQVETDALPPDALKAIFESALSEVWNDGAYKKVLAREAKDREELT